MIKKILLFFVFFVGFFWIVNNGFWQETNQNTLDSNKVTIYLFWWDWCPHCAKEKEFLWQLREKYPNISIRDYEVWYNKDNWKLLQKVAEKLDTTVSWVPFTIIGKKTISGYLNDSTTWKEIENQVLYCMQNKCEDIVSDLLECECQTKNNKKPDLEEDKKNDIISTSIDNSDLNNKKTENNKVNNIDTNEVLTWEVLQDKIIADINDIRHNDNNTDWKKTIVNETWEIQQIWVMDEFSLPIFWNISLKNYSLPIITIIFWTIDWFNPCALWILLFLMSMLIWMNDRKRMWILWSAFIFSSAVAYFFFMTAWLNIILFFWFLIWIRIWIWLFSIVWGWYNIREYFRSKNGWCNIVKEEKRTRVFESIKDIIHKKSFLIAFIWICILAFAVNIVELLCSAWLPVIYTQILSLNNLSSIQYYLYILLYIFFFMIDDLIIFSIWMVTLKVTWITTKYTRYSHLIWWILMLLVWVLLIFKPNILMFW